MLFAIVYALIILIGLGIIVKMVRQHNRDESWMNHIETIVTDKK